MFEAPLAAVGFERRRVVIALFNQTHLEDVVVKNFTSDEPGTMTSLAAFLTSVFAKQNIEYLAIEEPRGGLRLRQMHRMAIRTANDAGVPLQQVSGSELLNASASPPLNRRSQLRRMAGLIWPSLRDPRTGPAGLDAALLGLHVQLDRLFNRDSEIS
jgi:hypothetical protein